MPELHRDEAGILTMPLPDLNRLRRKIIWWWWCWWGKPKRDRSRRRVWQVHYPMVWHPTLGWLMDRQPTGKRIWEKINA